MSRRIAVLVSGAVLLLVFGVVGTLVPVPYVAQVPGPTFNTLGTIDGDPVITITGRQPNDVSGNLNLMTVGVSGGHLTLVEAVRGWFDRETVIVPREAVYPPDQSVEDIQAENRQVFLTSEQAAESAALRELGYPVKVVVQSVPDDSPSTGQLSVDDALESVAGRPTPTTEALSTVLASIPPGTTVPLTVTRGGQTVTVDVTTAAAPSGSGSRLGITVADMPSAPFGVSIDVADVGGPSAGLMLTLGILDEVGPTDLTGGRVIAGTGTIDADGAVGPIGGIGLKMIAARGIDAQLFLVPAENCAEALSAPQPGLTLAKVGTLDDALAALSDVRAGRTPATC